MRHTRAALPLALLLACKTPVSARPDADTHPPSPSASASASPPALPRPIGPYELPFDGLRTVFYVVPRTTAGPHRLLANLHGVCNPPGYACGYWVEAASKVGFLVCPSGNSHCGGPSGPPTWTQPLAKIDSDLEKAIAVVDANHPGEINREGAVLTGFSLGAYSAVQIARNHPGRWPYLIVNEADVALDATQLRAAGIKAVALIAGENGSQVAGERRTADKLAKQGFAARLWVMKGAGHYYSADIDTIMAEALSFVLSEGASPDAGAPR
jgi:predicted esterase